MQEFLGFLVDALPDGDVYLFGGVLRDLALFGRRGFDSDIDLVVEGDWSNCVHYLESLNASKNKFGGYRLEVSDWPVDIWNAKETWAIREGLVSWTGIESLLCTTVLNWDAILMSWRTRRIICGEGYVEEIQQQILDIVLTENPNPLGMAVRVFRHFCLKDAKKITVPAAEYMASCTRRYSYDQIRAAEIDSYGDSVIRLPIYRLFEHYGSFEGADRHRRIAIASDLLKMELGLQ